MAVQISAFGVNSKNIRCKLCCVECTQEKTVCPLVVTNVTNGLGRGVQNLAEEMFSVNLKKIHYTLRGVEHIQ